MTTTFFLLDNLRSSYLMTCVLDEKKPYLDEFNPKRSPAQRFFDDKNILSTPQTYNTTEKMVTMKYNERACHHLPVRR